jgi:formate dehydrogenase iron-sulfur subunit
MGLSRREFFKVGGSTSLALAMASTLEQESVSAAALGDSQFGVLVDISRCIGCRTCEAACKSANHLPAEIQAPSQRRLTAYTWTYVDKRLLPFSPTQTVARFVKKQCMHCLEPACVSVCPVGALQKSANGAVVYHDDRCIGCRYCMTACPFDVPRYQWESATPLIRKCQFCFTRLQQGQAPACTAACPAGTLTFGKRNELLAEAAARIKESPDKYVDYIYGKDEVGGTSVLYISNKPFAELGFRMDLPKDPLPDRTHAVMSKLPELVFGLAVVLGAGTVLNGRSLNGNGGNGNGASGEDAGKQADEETAQGGNT